MFFPHSVSGGCVKVDMETVKDPRSLNTYGLSILMIHHCDPEGMRI